MRRALLLLALTACGSIEEGVLLVPPPQDAGTRDAGRDAGVDAGRRDGGTRRDAGAPDSGVEDASMPMDLADRLRAIEGLEVREHIPGIPGTRAFELRLRQPEDHDVPNGASFRQRLVLVHRDERAPLVLHTTGYGLFGDPVLWTEVESEPTTALDANQLVVEHRYYAQSIAEMPNWIHLDIEQSARDSHRIVELLSPIYTGAWVGTGVSKGGMTAIFHQRFFPGDLAAIVPYVAPISFGIPDSRYVGWLAQIGPMDGVCRERVKDMAVEAIERRVELADYVRATDMSAAPYTDAQLEALVTLPAFGSHWIFWQYWASPDLCMFLPPRDGPIDTVALWFPFDSRYATGFGFDSEAGPYQYQVLNELGTPEIDDSHLDDAAALVDYSVLPPTMDEVPWTTPTFDPQAMMEVTAFLAEDAKHVLGVYGEWDPWTGGIISVDEANDNLVLMVPELNHGAQLSYLPQQQQDEALDRLATWIGRGSVAPIDWTRTRARMAARRADHRWIVERTLERDRHIRPR